MTSESPNSDGVFEDTIKNLLKMPPKPHKEAPVAKEDQSESDKESSKDRSSR